MATDTTAHSFPLGATSAQGISARVSALLAALADWQAARRNARALSRLTARQLDDIGLTAADVERMAHGVRF